MARQAIVTRRGSLRQKIMAFVGALVLISLLGSTFSLYRITAVNERLDAINRVVVPLGRLLAQMKTDADVLRREMERGLGYSHWNDPHWKPRAIPRWISEVLDNEVLRLSELVNLQEDWATPEERRNWRIWTEDSQERLTALKDLAKKLHVALVARDQMQAADVYPRWVATLEEWIRQMDWGARESERMTRQAFTRAQDQVIDLRTGLQMVLVVVVVLSFLLLWLGERALRPLSELTRLAREITRRGLQKGDKSRLPEIPLSRSDEVSQLSREFHNMATALLEREKTVEFQNTRLQEQLNEQIRLQQRLRLAENMAAVGRMSAQVAHEVRNPLHSIGLEAELAQESLVQGSQHVVKQSLASILASVDRLNKITENYLKFSRLSSGEKTRVDLGDVLESVLAAYASQCESAGVRVDWRRESGAVLTALGDRDLLEQALGNLIRNALQASPSRITCTLGNTESGKVWLRVRDNGPGIAAEVRDRLFTPFVTTRAQGTGLGLSFVKKVFEEHGGDVQLIDVADGEGGACFELTLPISLHITSEGAHAENPLS